MTGAQHPITEADTDTDTEARSGEFPPLLDDVADEGSEIDEDGNLHLADHDADGVCDPEIAALHLIADHGPR
jgi:hypothetical protein